ncbi:MAG TPA: hypothetical protein VEA99_17440 [Gemmatimonadaceae bacterium]|nr:hypothetical protein [Gemmatimonadaceae bacterium]
MTGGRWSGAMEQVPPSAERRAARLGAYAWWQLRDYLFEKGIGTLLVMLFAGSIGYIGAKGMTRFSPDSLRAPLSAAFSELYGQLVLLGVLFATNGIVSDDRKNGYYRFLFAKPVSVPRFYVQKFLVHLCGFLLVSAVLVLAFNLAFGRFMGEGGLPFASPAVLVGALALCVVVAAVATIRDDRTQELHHQAAAERETTAAQYAERFGEHLLKALSVALLLFIVANLAFASSGAGGGLPFMSSRVLPLLAVLFVALGGIGFLMSVVWRVDWLSFMLVYIVSNVAWTMFGQDAGWRGMAVRALPPVHRLSEIYRQVLGDAPLPMDDLRWLVLYGLACFVAGVAALRVRPLTGS